MGGTAAAVTGPFFVSSGLDDEIDALRRVLGIKQTDLARILKTTPRTVSRWRSTSSSHVEPRASSLLLLHDLFQLRWLLECDAGADSKRWIHSPNQVFRGRCPIDLLLEGDIRSVLGLVLVVQEGGFF